MRIDIHVRSAANALTNRQLFFLAAWFNMVHQSSLDSYRLRTMNPLNILREFSKISEVPHADDRDRAIVAEEAIEILSDHPILQFRSNHYKALTEVVASLAEAVQAAKKDKEGQSVFKQKSTLIGSFVRELDQSLKLHFINDTFDWLEETLNDANDGSASSPALEEIEYLKIERASRDLLSFAYDEGFGLESLYAIYKLLQPQPLNGSVQSTDTSEAFLVRFGKVRSMMTESPTNYRAFFVIDGMPDKGKNITGRYGDVKIIKSLPANVIELTKTLTKKLRAQSWTENDQRLFAEVDVESRDGRSAGAAAYRQIGQLLDLIRYKYDAINLRVTTDFLVLHNEKLLVLPLPTLIPNPKGKKDTGNLVDFFGNLQAIGLRDIIQTESRDRMLSAFRLYRVGTSVTLFENKLVNWWTATEYLAKGSKGGGPIGAGVEGALAPTLGLIYVSKHLSAYRSAFETLKKHLTIRGGLIRPHELTNKKLYELVQSPDTAQDLLGACDDEPYFFYHLKKFIENMNSQDKIAAMLRVHDRRVRWQVQRIYRARCDIVHSAQPVAMVGLLCANLEYYLRMTLNSMLQAFHEIPTMRGPGEFFERKKYLYRQLLSELEEKPVGKAPVKASSVLASILD
ncbi:MULTISPECIES: hypothetical protein [Xanthomonas]|uniref:Apea-like HEPN domain-containing protein n=1 Tax=Xanthomonas graminis pv. phlei TaxID=487906 RepID=A0A0K3A5Z8_9XANT|nr:MULTISPECIES: hypothetical protein [Xanthomonas]MCE4343823.1 hypothetical protein [Xanthomonas hortorum pv. vitians]UKE66609.1 hypothetical protein KM547_04845 [Xanthomonas translucens pv. phlei]UKE72425.1 hypothetical protein KFS85_15370 [Xanthomonas translucens pv. phleipratensis]CTP92702.1 hypothetical protein XTPLMG730_3586 [Xanthomonas translucens pv. phlei]